MSTQQTSSRQTYTLTPLIRTLTAVSISVAKASHSALSMTARAPKAVASTLRRGCAAPRVSAPGTPSSTGTARTARAGPPGTTAVSASAAKTASR